VAVDEATWLTCADPKPMLEFLRGRASERKLRLFACACCRRIWDLLDVEKSRLAVEVAEHYADGLAADEELAAARDAASVVARDLRDDADDMPLDVPFKKWLAISIAATAASAAARTAAPAGHAWWIVADNAASAAARLPPNWPAERSAGERVAKDAECAAQCHLLRDFFGPIPFRPVTIAPAVLMWNQSCALKLAQAAYEKRRLPVGPLDEARLAVLADSLEEAGCGDGDVLGHLRAGGGHYRGCFVVDMLLGKS
jgi:hypothetical protein